MKQYIFCVLLVFLLMGSACAAPTTIVKITSKDYKHNVAFGQVWVAPWHHQNVPVVGPYGRIQWLGMPDTYRGWKTYYNPKTHTYQRIYATWTIYDIKVIKLHKGTNYVYYDTRDTWNKIAIKM